MSLLILGCWTEFSNLCQELAVRSFWRRIMRPMSESYQFARFVGPHGYEEV
jgi:hypothetical protein